MLQILRLYGYMVAHAKLGDGTENLANNKLKHQCTILEFEEFV